jgi:hypothetical protein
MVRKPDENRTAMPPRLGVRNMGEPIRISNVEPISGFVAEAARDGEMMKVWTKLALTSDEPLFHKLAENFAGVVRHMAQQAGTAVSVSRADTVLLILKPDASAELWVDAAAVSLEIAVKRAMAAGRVIFEKDIADITKMGFPCVDFGPADKVLCLFRQDWRFGFAFDMNPEGKLDVDGFTTTLGTLHRELRYKHLYDALDDEVLFGRLIQGGWFPFAEIITSEFRELLDHCEAGFDFKDIENKILAAFDDERIQRVQERWLAKPHFAAKAELLQAALTAFKNKEPVAVLKILLTEIEGVLNDAHRAAHGGQGAKLKELLAFAKASAARKAGGSRTLLFPEAFGRYLSECTFANFDPVAQTGTAGSRHAVGHGAAPADSYTMTRALQAILTLDQLAFYT